MEFQGTWNLIGQDKVGGIPELTITKQKHLIGSLVPSMSGPSIMSRYMFNIACFLSTESDWLRKLLAECKNSGKSYTFAMQLFTARQENKEMTEQTEKEHFREPHHTKNSSDKISRCWLLMKSLFSPKPWNLYLPPDFFGKIPKHFDVHLTLALNSKFTYTSWASQ